MIKKIAIPVGDPAGIGPEITLKAFLDKSFASAFFSQAIPILYASRKAMDRCAEQFAPELRLCPISDESEAHALNTVYLRDTGDVDFRPGMISAETGASAHRSILCAASAATNKAVNALCTGPIHKQALRMAGIADIGHTEILANAFHAEHPLTLFVTRALRIFFFTRHLSLRQALDALNTEKITQFAILCHDSLSTLGFHSPKLALAALNPHASDGGQFGTEEAEILTPAVLAAQKAGVNLVGPVPADSVFAQAAAGKYDAVLSLFHDQGHIAAKTYDFDRTISATLGLPCLRASVDHGTALDIAWTGKAQCVSMQEALSFAAKFG